MRLVFVLLALAVTALPSPVWGEGAQVDGLNFSFEDDSEKEKEVILLDIGAEKRFDFRFDNKDGTYQHGYQSGRLGDDGGYNFKHEYKQEDGVRFGQYGYELPDGTNQTVNYVADANGYRVLAEGQKYVPVSERELERRRGILEDIQAEEEEQEPLNLDLTLLERIADPAEVELESDPAVALSAAKPLQPHSQLDPDTNAFQFGFRSASDDGVLYRHEERDEEGVVSGQYGYRPAGGEPVLVSYVSDAFGYRVVDPAAPVAVVSQQQAQEQLGELAEGSGLATEETAPAAEEEEEEEEDEEEMKPTPEGGVLPVPRPVAAPELEAQSQGQAQPEQQPQATLAATGGATVDSVRPYFRPHVPQLSAVLPYGALVPYAAVPYAAVHSPAAHVQQRPRPVLYQRPLPYPVYRYPQYRAAAEGAH
ncbi:uncharacterized protein LOC119099751 [Pollicipes pollicipes]|uniref:uncharacterized protein LOC119099751 n=1 Tax=Pollicipes pollicipes TaxID=41117 RepID=UPI0018851ABE|nr:uncharacterized protein LOC119099751 [Pollicipes pollicipes]